MCVWFWNFIIFSNIILFDTLANDRFSQASLEYIKEEKEIDIKKEYTGEYIEYFKEEKDF